MTRPEKFAIRFLAPEQSVLRRALDELGVDPCGIRIMLPKGEPYLVRMGPVSHPAANILKQEMLSLGGDCALPKDAVTGRMRASGCILIGNAAQLLRLREKLRRQPFGLGHAAAELDAALANYGKKEYTLGLRGKKIRLGRVPLVMGIINVTPDSFSGDGMAGRDTGRIVEHALKMEADGAAMIDIGGESSRSGAKPVPAAEELRRVIPLVRALSRTVRVPLSVDTRKPEVARRALDNGASVINDITGLRDPAMARACAACRCAVVIMHMKGTPATMMKRFTRYGSLLDEVTQFFRRRMGEAAEAGIREESIILDPGIGFAKDAGQNLEILKNLRQFKSLGRPLLAGVSRKSFIGKILDGAPPQERLAGSLAACAVAAANGADILRVHDVKETLQAVKTACAIADS